MKELKGIKTEYYEYNENFIVMVEKTPDTTRVWLNHKEYSYGMFLFGTPTKETTKKVLKVMILQRIERYIELYFKDIKKLESEV